MPLCTTTPMHGSEKSDKAIVLKKPLNNAPEGAAEVVEGRALAKGNCGQTTATWTQSQGTASRGLVAVRQAAKGGKGIRLTALLHHITVDLLRKSYYALKREAAPGIDGVTWHAYGEDLET